MKIRTTPAGRLGTYVLRRTPFERQKMALWVYGERWVVHPGKLGTPTSRRGKVAFWLADRLDRAGMWLNRHELTRRAKR